MYPSVQHDHGNFGVGAIPTAPHVPVQPQYLHTHTPSFNARSKPWSTGLCHCCDDPANCLITCCCPCITFGQISEIVGKGSRTCAYRGTWYGLLVPTGLACLYSCFYRSKLRAQYNLEEAPFADCLVHFCCEVCALCQEYRELKIRGLDMGIGWQANMDRQQMAGITTAPSVEGDMSR